MTASSENKISPSSPNRYTFTVFTPTYNRAHTLHRVYQSLQNQTFRDFEWLIVDDGSTDSTPDLIQNWQAGAGFPIRYLWQENQGVNMAINRGVQEAIGRLFLISGSDDSFVPETLALFQFHWQSIPEEERGRFVGVTALCMDPEGRITSDRLPAEILDSDSLEIRFKYRIKGEMWGFLKTEVLRRFPFPSIPGSKFVPEGIVWNSIARHFKTRFINRPLRIYWNDPTPESDQLTRTYRPGRYAAGQAYWHLFRLNEEIEWFSRAPFEFLRSALHYGRFSLHAGTSVSGQLKNLKNNRARLLWLAMLPAAVLVFLRDPR